MSSRYSMILTAMSQVPRSVSQKRSSRHSMLSIVTRQAPKAVIHTRMWFSPNWNQLPAVRDPCLLNWQRLRTHNTRATLGSSKMSKYTPRNRERLHRESGDITSIVSLCLAPGSRKQTQNLLSRDWIFSRFERTGKSFYFYFLQYFRKIERDRIKREDR